VQTNIARRMVTEYGMSEPLGPVGARNDYSDKIAEAIDDEIRRLVDAASARARSIIAQHLRRRRPYCASASAEGVS
jgi:cell division protease FtsH